MGALVGQVAAGDNEDGGSYALRDPRAFPGLNVAYALFVVTRDQRVIWVADRVARVPLIPTPQPLARAAVVRSEAAPLGGSSWIGDVNRVQAWTESAPANRVRLGVRIDGVYHVTAAELATAFGRTLGEVELALTNGIFALTREGLTVAWESSGDSLRFYGNAPTSRYAPENVYWLALANGTRMAESDVTPPPGAVANAHFTHTLHVQGTAHRTRVAFGTLTEYPYLGFFPSLAAGNSLTVDTALVDPAAGPWTGQLTVNLISNFNVLNDDHTNRVSVGGVEVGRNGWRGEGYSTRTYDFNSARVSSGVLSSRVENLWAKTGQEPNDGNALFIWVSQSIGYQRLYRAVGGQLLCTGGPSNSVSVSAFASPDIGVWDTTNPHVPVLLTNTLVEAAGGGQWKVTFASGDAAARYAVFSRSTGCYQPAVRGVRDVDWGAASNSADYIILIPPEGWVSGFRQALQPLADYRARQGLVTRIVDVESVYNRYSHGLAHPQAIRDFVADAYLKWQPRRIRYLLLAGQGSLDFNQTALGLSPVSYSACLIPTLILPQTFYSYSGGVVVGGEGMTAAVDACFGDVNGNPGPEVAVGRLPVVSTQQAALAVSKTLAYERLSPSTRRKTALAADYSVAVSGGLTFTNSIELTVPDLLSVGRAVTRVYPVDGDPNYKLNDEWLSLLKPALASGSGLFHYFGHSGATALGYKSDLLSNTRVQAVPPNWSQPLIAVLMGCHVNRWHSPYNTSYFGPTALLTSGSGFSAVIASTAYLGDRDGHDFGIYLYAHAATRRTLRLGDAWREGLVSMDQNGTPDERYMCLSLIGDPALVLRHDASGFADGSVLMIR